MDGSTTVTWVFAATGCILILAALIGGNFQFLGATIPSVPREARIVCFVAGAVLVGLAMGFRDTRGIPTPPAPVSAPPVIHYFSASPKTVSAGQTVELQWKVSNATDVSIADLGIVKLEGTRSTAPRESVEYWLTANNADGRQTKASCIVQVRPASTADLPPTVEIHVSPSVVKAGQNFTVTVTGRDDRGLAAIWWFGLATGDPELNKAHWKSCSGERVASNTWTVATQKVGVWTLGANARDTAYNTQAGRGSPHQASEGEGMAKATITVTR